MPGPATSGELPLSRVHELAAELEKGGAAKANNAARLIAVLNDSSDADVVKAAIQGLKLFFVDASQGGDLGNAPKKLKAEGVSETASAATGPSDSAEDVYRTWLKRQYSAYVAGLLGLLRKAGVKPATQIVAVGALMEAVRCEQGVGVFSGNLYCQLINALVTSSAVHPEVFTFLFTRYLQYTDVRYFTHWAVREIASERAGKLPAAERTGRAQDQQPSSSAGTAENAKASKAGAGAKRKGASAATASASPAAASSAGAGAGAKSSTGAGPHAAPLEDVARCLFDVLVNIPEGMGSPGEEGEGEALSSWCGMEQAGTVLPSADPNQSAKQRRKRRAQDAEAQEGAVATAAWASPKAHKRVFSEAWLALLQLPIPGDILRKVLVRLHSAVLPRMTNPLLLSDFLTFSLNQGGIIGMLALNAIFQLVTQHGLEYPRFYERLYQLITPQAFAAKYRAQFFRLADLFLSSGLVPAYTVAAFAKKMARLGVSAPPSGALAAIAFVHNLIRRHPACMVLLHNPPGGGGAGPKAEGAATASAGGVGQDVFDVCEPDPAKSRAVESSLWELGCYRNHYCPQVAALCQVLDKDLTDRTKTSEVDVEPLLDTSYSSLFTSEAERRLKQVPLAYHVQPPTKLFDASCKEDFGGWVL